MDGSQEQVSTQDDIVEEHSSTEFTITIDDNDNKLAPEFTSPEKVVKRDDDEKEFGSPSTCFDELEQELQRQRRLLENEIETHVIDKANGHELITKSTKSLAAVENELLMQQELVEEVLGNLLSDSQQKLDTIGSTSNELNKAYHNVTYSEITDEKKEEVSTHSKQDTMSFTSNEMHDEADYDVAHSELTEEKKEDASTAPTSFGELLLAGSWQDTPLAKEIGDVICATSSMVSLENGCCVSVQETLDSVLDEELLLAPPPANEIPNQDDLESLSSTENHDAVSALIEKVGVITETKTADNEIPSQDDLENSRSSVSNDVDAPSPSIENVGVQSESKTDSSRAEADKISDAPTCAPVAVLPVESNEDLSRCDSTKIVEDCETEIRSHQQSVPVLEGETSIDTCTPQMLESAFKENKAIYVKDKDYGWVPALQLETTPKTAIVSIALGSFWCKSTIGDITEKKEEEDEKPSKSKRLDLKKKDKKRIAEKYGVPVGTVRAVRWKDYKDGTLPLQNSEAGKGDMVDLVHLHEASILFNLKERHYQSMPYTRVGDIMVAMNPFVWINDLYAPNTQERYTTSLIWNGKQNIARSFVRLPEVLLDRFRNCLKLCFFRFEFGYAIKESF